MLRWLTVTAIALAILVAGFALWVRFAPDDSYVNAEPLEAPGTGNPNSWRVGPEGSGPQPLDATTPAYSGSPAYLAATFDAFAMAQPRVKRLSVTDDDLCVTYIQRSRIMGFPDYFSIRFLDLGNGKSGVAAFSRARYGRNDFGVNRARVENWLAALDPFAR
jgi:uncharacterized protein (DUF1499 family)